MEQYLRTLYDLAEHADFPEQEETIRDHLVLELLDNEISQKLQLEPNLTLQMAIDAARHYELVRKEIPSHRQPDVAAVF